MRTHEKNRLVSCRRIGLPAAFAAALLAAGCSGPQAEQAPTPDDEYELMMKQANEALDSGTLPIDRAMAEYASKPRGDFPMVAPKPSEDESALSGWSFAGAVAVAAGDATMPPECTGAADPMACWGQKLSNSKGCMACHAVDGVKQQPCPNWKGLHGMERLLVGGDKVVADEEYLANSILNSWDQVVEGYGKTMPPYNFPEQEIDALVAYIKSLGEGG